MRGRMAKAAVQSALTLGALEFSGELYSLAKGFGPFLRGFGQALEKGRVLFLVTTSTSPSLQAYAELHAFSPLRGSISPWYSATGLESKMPVFLVFLCVFACIL